MSTVRKSPPRPGKPAAPAKAPVAPLKAAPSAPGVAPITVPRRSTQVSVRESSVVPPPQPAIVAPPTQLPNAPSIQSRYATKGSAPQVSLRSPLLDQAETVMDGTSMDQLVALVQQAVSQDSSTDGTIHLHLHSPLHIHLKSSKL